LGEEEMKLYIAGPMTGIKDNNFPEFFYTENHLLYCGYEVCNPAKIGAPGLTWREYMMLDIPELMKCDGVCVLDDWFNSKGASLEVSIAKALDIPIQSLDYWIRISGK
jgi:hypothetical protein